MICDLHGHERGWTRKAGQSSDGPCRVLKGEVVRSDNTWPTPLAKPPKLDWEFIGETDLPSAERTKILFPHNPEKRARMKDLEGKRIALWQCLQWTCSSYNIVSDPGRQRLYTGLEKEVLTVEGLQ